MWRDIRKTTFGITAPNDWESCQRHYRFHILERNRIQAYAFFWPPEIPLREAQRGGPKLPLCCPRGAGSFRDQHLHPFLGWSAVRRYGDQLARPRRGQDAIFRKQAIPFPACAALSKTCPSFALNRGFISIVARPPGPVNDQRGPVGEKQIVSCSRGSSGCFGIPREDKYSGAAQKARRRANDRRRTFLLRLPTLPP
jgi:hypothetical protein